MTEPLPHPDKPLSESQTLILRRKLAGVEPEQPHIGLALSGGGVRSATFSLGFLRRLAKNELLHRVDYLSTVSGGGYTGGMLGRLYSQQNNPDRVEKALAKDDTLLLWWLRNNGRYLTPAGMSDLAQSAAQIVRSFLFTFFLITLLSTLVCTLAISLRSFYGPDLKGISQIFAIPLALGAWQCAAYWLFERRKLYFVIALPLLILALLWLVFLAQPPRIPGLVIFLLCAGPAIIQALSMKKGVAAFRLFLTRSLTTCLMVLTGLAFIWLLNRLGYGLYRWLENADSLYYAIPAGLTLAKLIGELRPVQQAGKKIAAAGKKANPQTPINLAGLLFAFAVLVAGCAGLINFTNHRAHDFSSLNPHYLLLIEALAPLIILICWHSLPEYLNLSSLHNLYRARIERAWVSVANYRSAKHRSPRFPTDPLQPYTRQTTDGIVKVTTALPDDDINFTRYNPAEYGGPLHLINCCINQTVDDRTGNYSADRKGIALTVSKFGVETGTQQPQLPDDPDRTKLSSWLAISGAAVSTGMGSLTSPGLAFLMFFFGARLGYWSKRLLPSAAVDPAMPEKNSPFWNTFSTLFAPAGYLFGELFARFPGLGNKQWFLSDGGHFENTAVYSLLKRRLPIIIVTDCGADPEYRFEDMENLVRKAQIDYQTPITFYDFSASPLASFGNQQQMKANATAPPLLMARINYPDCLPGVLIVAKPHWLENMPLDTFSYAARNRAFPQQSTADQFFDEAQWEAYHQLGWQTGHDVSWRMLDKALRYAREHAAP
jgi:hypothetical protein